MDANALSPGSTLAPSNLSSTEYLSWGRSPSQTRVESKSDIEFIGWAFLLVFMFDPWTHLSRSSSPRSLIWKTIHLQAILFLEKLIIGGIWANTFQGMLLNMFNEAFNNMYMG
ncbi:hypothetical protein ACJX0J_039799 [Zea mays]